MPESLIAFVGPAAGIATSLLWTATSLLFTAAARRIGSVNLNGLRIACAIVLLAVTHRALAGMWIPDIGARQVWLLGLSGVMGLSIGDQALLQAFVNIGPRLSLLVMTTSPLFAAFFGWIALGETLHGTAWLGIALVVGGVGWVVLERPEADAHTYGRRRAQGIALAVVGAACQAGGLLLSKQGMGHGWLPPDQRLDPQAATLVRMFFAGLGVLPIMAIHAARGRKRRAAGVTPSRLGSPRAGYMFAMAGAVVGPYLGVWMSLVAADLAPLGIAQTLCSLTPIFILPFAARIHRERISPRAVLGAVIAVGGAAALVFSTQ